MPDDCVKNSISTNAVQKLDSRRVPVGHIPAEPFMAERCLNLCCLLMGDGDSFGIRELVWNRRTQEYPNQQETWAHVLRRLNSEDAGSAPPALADGMAL
jgi:hypothetical protein